MRHIQAQCTYTLAGGSRWRCRGGGLCVCSEVVVGWCGVVGCSWQPLNLYTEDVLKLQISVNKNEVFFTAPRSPDERFPLPLPPPGQSTQTVCL